MAGAGVEYVEGSGMSGLKFEITGAEGDTVLTFSTNTYIHSVEVTYEKEEEKDPVLDTSKVDVWDFGAMTLDATKYNNNLTVDVINGLYPGVEAGASGANIASFTVKDGAGQDALKFNDGGNHATHRLRTTNTNLTRYDGKSKSDGTNTYDGFIYSNAGSTENVNLEVYLYKGDILTAYLGSNGGTATYKFVGDEYEDSFVFTASNSKATVEKAVFYAPTTGWYKLWCSNEKLVCARLLREHVPTVQVTGSVTAPDSIPAGYKLVFTNDINGAKAEADVVNGVYSVSLMGRYPYTVSLEGANGYIVKDGSKFELGTEDAVNDINIINVAQHTVTGKITGLNADQYDRLAINFESDKIFVPEFSFDKETGEFKLIVENDVEYTVTADGVNDYTLETTTVKVNTDKTLDIEFSKKPVYPITVTVTGVSDTSGALVEFTNINEDGYVYTFGIKDKIDLRDGQYKVKLKGIATSPVAQGKTADVIVKGEAATATIPMVKLAKWDFAALNPDNDVTAVGDEYYYAGLKVANVIENKTYLLASAKADSDAVIKIPNVKQGDEIVISYCYSASFKAGDKVVSEKSGSTGKIDSVTVTADKDGEFVITGVMDTIAGGQTYFCSIEVKEQSGYRSVLRVGADKQYKTINDALEVVRKMARKESQPVTIMIDPGNYEEMLVIDVPNLKLMNASDNPSIALTNKGVGIDPNAVRITWYYGTGYDYYSMDANCKYNERVLEVNKANGYLSNTNPGDGTTRGSYWNASVVVTASNFEAEGIIFENSFNQYVSAKSVEDVIVPNAKKKEGTVPRASMKTVGDTKVQEKEYVERAAALAISNGLSNIFFDNCKFVGRQDTLYGGVNTTVAFNKCDIYGGTDYIFGGMIAVFNECNLVFNTNDQTEKGAKDDVGYITAPQQQSGRGYLMYKCHITSTVPGVDTASQYTSKPGYLGRPWQAGTGEAVFVGTTIDAADEHWVEQFGKSLIRPVGWMTTLGGQSSLFGEYGTIEKAGVNNSAARASWASADASTATIDKYLGSWDPFDGVSSFPEKEAVIEVTPDEDADVPVEGVKVSDDTVIVDDDDNEVSLPAGKIVEVTTEKFADTPEQDTVKSEMESIAKVNAETNKEMVKDVCYINIDAKVDGAIVKIAGKIKITLEIPVDINYNPSTDTITVLHKVGSKVKEETVNKIGGTRKITIEVGSLSPFALVVSTPKQIITPFPPVIDTDDDGTIIADGSDGSSTSGAATGSTTNAGQKDYGTSVKTGDTAPVLPLVIIAIACVGAILICSRKRAR